MKYPAGVKVVPTVHKKEDIQYGNRGMSLEHDLNITNDYTGNLTGHLFIKNLPRSK